VDVDFPEPWGTQEVHIIEENISSTSVFEPGEDERYLRYVATITMEAWLPLPYEWRRTVQKFGFSIIDENNSNLVIAALETEYADKQEFWDSGDKTQVLEWI
jgi:hypothetical protein